MLPLIHRAASPGRIRGIGTALWAEARARPSVAGAVLHAGLRRARALHSAERRLVQDVLYGLVRSEIALTRLLGTDDPLALWLGWLVCHADLDPALAEAELPGPPWGELLARSAELGAELGAAERLALRHGLPAPVVDRLLRLLGDEAAAFLAASDERAPVVLRANRRRCTASALAARLAYEAIATEPLPQMADGLRVIGRANLEGTAAFQQGWFEVQDEGSQRIVELIPPGDHLVIDACAGAGGKALALAARGARVLALDVRESALRELDRRARRAGVAARIETRTVEPDVWPDDLPLAPVVLVDAPCSGTGVLRRHPEHRWQLDEDTLASRAALQRALLSRAAGRVAPEGTLLYATCSVLPDENEQVVESFLEGHPGWALRSTVRTWPQRDGCDGFFAAVLARA